jgi:RNA recognition motif-containing protein
MSDNTNTPKVEEDLSNNVKKLEITDLVKVSAQVKVPENNNNANKLFVRRGDVKNWSSKILHEIFSTYGKIVQAFIREDRFRRSRANFGQVTFVEDATVTKVMADVKDNKLVTPHGTLEVSRFNAGSNRSVENPEQRPQRQIRSLFIGKLPEGTTKEDLQTFFGKYGEFDGHYVKHNNTGSIIFKKTEDATKVLELFRTDKTTFTFRNTQLIVYPFNRNMVSGQGRIRQGSFRSAQPFRQR